MRGISAVLLLAACSALGQEDPLQKAISEFHRGQYSAALASLAKAPDSSQRRTFEALAHAGLGHCDTAAAALSREFETATDSALRRLSGLALTQCAYATGHYDDAFPVLAKLNALYPGDADVLYQAARLHMKAWNETLFEMYRKAPSSFRVNQVSAEVFETQNRYTEAIAEYRKAIAKNPTALNLHFRLGRALLLESHSPENLAAAQHEFEAELALNASDAVAEYEIGQILLASQKPEEATKRFERATALNPDFAEALQAVAKSRMEGKQYGDAATLLERVVRLQPSNESAHYSLMMAYRNAGRTADAAREQAALEKLRQAPEGEFTEFLKRLGEKAPKQ